jgi:hypothetical protein
MVHLLSTSTFKMSRNPPWRAGQGLSQLISAGSRDDHDFPNRLFEVIRIVRSPVKLFTTRVNFNRNTVLPPFIEQVPWLPVRNRCICGVFKRSKVHGIKSRCLALLSAIISLVHFIEKLQLFNLTCLCYIYHKMSFVHATAPPSR